MLQELLIWLSWKLETFYSRSLIDEIAWKFPRFQRWLVKGIYRVLIKRGRRMFGNPEMQGLPWSAEDDAELKRLWTA